MLDSLPKDVIFNLIKYNPSKIIDYTLKIKLELDWQKLYYFLYNEKNILGPYTYPNINENKWLNGIIIKNQMSFNFFKKKEFKNPTEKLLEKCDLSDLSKNQIKNIIKLCRNNAIALLILKNKTIMSSYSFKKDISEKIKYEFVCDSKGNVVKNIIDICYCNTHIILLLNNGTIMSAGCNEYGSLGLGDKINRKKFELVCDNSNKPIQNVCKVYCEQDISFLLLNNGTVMSCGSNSGGKLGLCISRHIILQFDRVKYIFNVISIKCGCNSTLLLLKDGKILFSGRDYNHKFTNNKYCDTYKFTEVIDIKKAMEYFTTDKEL